MYAYRICILAMTCQSYCISAWSWAQWVIQYYAVLTCVNTTEVGEGGGGNCLWNLRNNVIWTIHKIYERKIIETLMQTVTSLEATFWLGKFRCKTNHSSSKSLLKICSGYACLHFDLFLPIKGVSGSCEGVKCLSTIYRFFRGVVNRSYDRLHITFTARLTKQCKLKWMYILYRWSSINDTILFSNGKWLVINSSLMGRETTWNNDHTSL